MFLYVGNFGDVGKGGIRCSDVEDAKKLLTMGNITNEQFNRLRINFECVNSKYLDLLYWVLSEDFDIEVYLCAPSDEILQGIENKLNNDKLDISNIHFTYLGV